MGKRKILVVLIAFCLLSCCLLSACSSDKMSMSLDKISEAVIYNQSMVGVGKEFTENIRTKEHFTNTDANKMKYITNNMYSDEFTVTADLTIVQGIYYAVFLTLNDVDYARAVVVFIEFEDAESAGEAANVINANLNLENNAAGTCNLTFGEAVARKNVVCVIACQEINTFLELKRVFLSNSYVR